MRHAAIQQLFRAIAVTMLISVFWVPLSGDGFGVADGSEKWMPQDQTSNAHFDGGSFKDEYWIGDKRVFPRPVGVDVEFVTAGPFDWIFAGEDGKEARTTPCKNEHGGWTGVHLASLGLHGNYSIGFRNKSADKQEIKQIDVRLK
jgi:hypothetical protein